MFHRSSSTLPQIHLFLSEISASLLRLNITGYHGRPCLRLELLGCTRSPGKINWDLTPWEFTRLRVQLQCVVLHNYNNSNISAQCGIAWAIRIRPLLHWPRVCPVIPGYISANGAIGGYKESQTNYDLSQEFLELISIFENPGPVLVSNLPPQSFSETSLMTPRWKKYRVMHG